MLGWSGARFVGVAFFAIVRDHSVCAQTSSAGPSVAPTPSPAQSTHPRPTWNLGVKEKAWTVGSDKVETISTQTYGAGFTTQTECYSGNGQYLNKKVLCDRLCMEDPELVGLASGRDSDFFTDTSRCNGPWYCARTEVCEMFREDDRLADRSLGDKRSCAIVHGCANHSQCFPNEDEAVYLNINTTTLDTSIDVGKRKDAKYTAGFKMHYGGLTTTTKCCYNEDKKGGYQIDIDVPCNSLDAAVAVKASISTALLAAALATWLAR